MNRSISSPANQFTIGDSANAVDEKLYKYSNLVRKCGLQNQLKLGKCVHAQIVSDGLEQNTLLCNHLITMYSRCQRPQESHYVFNKMEMKNVFSWTCMITAYAQNGHPMEALHMFHIMSLEGLQPNPVTMIVVITACCANASVVDSIHQLAISTGFDQHIVVATSLITTYSKCGRLREAREVFNRMKLRNVVSWNAMISAYVQHRDLNEAIVLFRTMDIPPNNVTFSSLLAACRSLNGFNQTRKVHMYILLHGLERDALLVSALIDAYSKCGSLDEAKFVFERVMKVYTYACLDPVCWTAMAGAYVLHGCGDEAIKLFHRMDLEGLKVDQLGLVNFLGACKITENLRQGRVVHARIEECGFLGSDDIVATALASMYAECGSPDEGKQVFGLIHRKDAVAWNGMISAYSREVNGNESAIEFFREMQLDGTRPTSVTYVSVLHSCSHKGLVERARVHFGMIYDEDGVGPLAEHYRCMVDVLARSGRIKDAEELTVYMPFEPGIMAWKAVLAASRTHGESGMAGFAAKKAIEIGPELPQLYLMLSSVYSDEKHRFPLESSKTNTR